MHALRMSDVNKEATYLYCTVHRFYICSCLTVWHLQQKVVAENVIHHYVGHMWCILYSV